MIQAECPRGQTASQLDATLHRLRHALNEYQTQLKQSEAAFQVWEERWTEREREIDGHLAAIQSNLNSPLSRPVLSIVRDDEDAS
jgi:hypothetical protein